MSNLGLIPVRNFGILDEVKGLYRSAQPMYGYEYEWLKNVLNVKTIVNLRSESNHDTNVAERDRKSTRLNSSHSDRSRMPSSA